MHKLFRNIPQRVKALAFVLFVFFAAAGIVAAVSFWVIKRPFLDGLGALFLGLVTALLSCWLVWALGEAADTREEVNGLRQEIQNLRHLFTVKTAELDAVLAALPKKYSSYEPTEAVRSARAAAKDYAGQEVDEDAVLAGLPNGHAALREQIGFALRYQTETGMRGYLNHIRPLLSAEDQSSLDSALKEANPREALTKMIRKA